LNFAEQQRHAHRERQKRLGKIPPVRPVVGGPMASSNPASPVQKPRASVPADPSGASNAVPEPAATTSANKEPGSNEEWQISPASGVRAVIRAVARYYSVSVRDIVSHRRTRRLIRPRHVAMYLAHERGRYSLAIIGGVLGRDHTTIMHACRRIAELRQHDPQLDREIRMLIGRVTPKTPDGTTLKGNR
jgi:hypothetical protein